jgi:hypothetical protein
MPELVFFLLPSVYYPSKQPLPQESETESSTPTVSDFFLQTQYDREWRRKPADRHSVEGDTSLGRRPEFSEGWWIP